MPVIVSPACRSTTLDLLVVDPLNPTDDKMRIFFISFSISFFIFWICVQAQLGGGLAIPAACGQF
jgi:hypothetical protein